MNLTCASHVVFLHPFFHEDQERASAWEAQAIGRVTRPGQLRRVHVWRFLARSTVEAELAAHDSWREYFSKFTDGYAAPLRGEAIDS